MNGNNNDSKKIIKKQLKDLKPGIIVFINPRHPYQPIIEVEGNYIDNEFVL